MGGRFFLRRCRAPVLSQNRAPPFLPGYIQIPMKLSGSAFLPSLETRPGRRCARIPGVFPGRSGRGPAAGWSKEERR